MSAQDSNRVYHYEPWPLEIGQQVWTIGFSTTVLPTALVEDEYPIPALEASTRIGIGPQISFIGSLSTIGVSSLLQLGAQWNTGIDPVSIAAGANMAGFYGYLSTESQFESNSAYGIAAIPFVRVGYRHPDFSLSATFAASFVIDAESKVGPFRAPGPSQALNDVFITLAAEQPFFQDSRVSLGVSLNYSRTPYQSWITLNTIDQFLFLPEFFIGYQLPGASGAPPAPAELNGIEFTASVGPMMSWFRELTTPTSQRKMWLGYDASVRVMWHPGRHMLLGFTTGLVEFAREEFDVEQTLEADTLQTDHGVLRAIPLQLTTSMRFDGLEVGVGIGPYLMMASLYNEASVSGSNIELAATSFLTYDWELMEGLFLGAQLRGAYLSFRGVVSLSPALTLRYDLEFE